jgi:hypothetical protein
MGPRDLRPGLLGGAHDVGRGLIQHAVIEGLESDANSLCHVASSLLAF